jgi:hypothetical protein
LPLFPPIAVVFFFDGARETNVSVSKYFGARWLSILGHFLSSLNQSSLAATTHQGKLTLPLGRVPILKGSPKRVPYSGSDLPSLITAWLSPMPRIPRAGRYRSMFRTRLVQPFKLGTLHLRQKRRQAAALRERIAKKLTS